MAGFALGIYPSQKLRVSVANGYYDMATPFYAMETTVAGNGIEAGRVRMTYYDAGHMMYLHPPSFGRMVADLRELIRPAGSADPEGVP